jgi:hypothetical protein
MAFSVPEFLVEQDELLRAALASWTTRAEANGLALLMEARCLPVVGL